MRAGYPDGSGMPEVQITNPAGGVLGGDRLEVGITAQPNSTATVITQAANKAYKGATASQHTTVRLEEAVTLEYLPHHLIPFAHSDYRQTTTFHLAPDAALLTWDAFAAGRVARGERFAFTRLRARTTILRNDAPEAIDGLDLTGDQEHFGGHSYAAAAHILAPQDLTPLAENLHDRLTTIPGTLASASAPAHGLCTIRILAHNATWMYRALNDVRASARKFLGMSVAGREVW